MTTRGEFSEDTRQAVHMAMGGFALALPYLSWWYATTFALLAVFFNLGLLQRLTWRPLFRPSEVERVFTSGIVLYPTAVFALLLAFPGRPDIVGAAWGILAAGDGMASIIGRRWPISRLPWNGEKSVGGSLAFVAFGGTAGACLAWWCGASLLPPPYLWFMLAGPFVAAIAAAAVETIPIRLDDNVSVSASAGAVMWALSLVSEDLIAAALAAPVMAFVTPVIVNAMVAGAGYAARTVTVAGAVTGAVIGSVIFFFAGVEGWLLLMASFGFAVVTSRMGLGRKRSLGIAEGRGGRRGPGNAIANTGVAAGAAAMSGLTYAHEPAILAFVAALVAGSSDTVASEIGKAWGRRTFLITTARRVEPGTPGAMSLEGTAAGLLGAALLASIAAALGLLDWRFVLIVIAAATAGALVESALGATLEERGILNNDVLNFVNTACAAYAVILLWQWL